MVVVKNDKVSFYMEGVLQTNLDLIKKASTLDWDFIFIVDGIEGAGKSVFAQQLAFYLDPTLKIERICFSPKEFKEACLSANKYEAVIFDEAITGGNIREAMADVNIALMNMLGQIRQKNLYIIIVLPSFFDLDRYIALWRSRALFHIYAKAYNDRGYFWCYKDRKNYLWISNRKYFYYDPKLKDFNGRFSNKYVVDETEYRKKKADVLTRIDDGKTNKGTTKADLIMKQRDIMIYNAYNNKSMSVRKIAQELTLNDKTIYQILHRIEDSKGIIPTTVGIIPTI